jgi:positive regulator of sigma E activity
LNSIRTRPAKLLNELGWRRTLLFAAMILVLPPLVGWAVSALIGHGGQELISAITTMLVVIGGWLRTASQAAAKVDQAVTEVAEAYESRIATDSKVQEARQNLASGA